MEQTEILRAEGLKKVFRSGRSDLVLFDNLSLQVRAGEMVAIVGQSGAGKSTLLHILGALDRPSAGEIYCSTIKLQALSDEAASRTEPDAAGEAQLDSLRCRRHAACHVTPPPTAKFGGSSGIGPAKAASIAGLAATAASFAG